MIIIIDETTTQIRIAFAKPSSALNPPKNIPLKYKGYITKNDRTGIVFIIGKLPIEEIYANVNGRTKNGRVKRIVIGAKMFIKRVQAKMKT